MAPRIKPLEEQKGHITIVTMQRRKLEQELAKPEKKLPKRPPESLSSDAAKKEWRRLVKILDEMEYSGEADRDNAVVYCNALAGYAEATANLEKMNKQISAALEAGNIPSATIMGMKRHFMTEQNNYAAQIKTFGGKLGLNMDSRFRVAAKKVEAEEEKISKRFGAI